MSKINLDAYRFARRYWPSLEAYQMAKTFANRKQWALIVATTKAEDLDYIFRTARPLRRKDHWGPRQGFTLAARKLTLRELTDKQLDRLARKVYDRIKLALGGGDRYGIDWPTLRAVLPGYASAYSALCKESNRRARIITIIGRSADERRAVRAKLADTLKTTAKSLCKAGAKPLPTVIELTSYGSREYSIYQGEVDEVDGDLMILR